MKTRPAVLDFESPMSPILEAGDSNCKTLFCGTGSHGESPRYDERVGRQHALQGHVDRKTFDEAKARASVEGRSLSSLVSHAVRMYLAGGAEKFAEVLAKQGPPPEPDPTPDKVVLYGERIHRLPEQIQVKVMEYADALELLYAKRRAANGEVALIVGTVTNTWVEPAGAGAKSRRRPGSRTRARKGTGV